MSSKTTRFPTRKEAVELYVSLKAQLKRRKWEAQAVVLSDMELGNELDVLCERAATENGETCFNNYIVGHSRS